MLELAAAILGLINVWLITKRTVWNYPFGIAMTVMFAFVFYEAHLFSDMLLQVFFTVVQVYGWWVWNENPDKDGLVVVETMTLRPIMWAAAWIFGGFMLLGGFMSTYTIAAMPFWDALMTSMSVTAQVLLSRRKLESWVIWIVVDLISLYIYASKGLYITLGLYTVFLFMAMWGLYKWASSMEERLAYSGARATDGEARWIAALERFRSATRSAKMWFERSN